MREQIFRCDVRHWPRLPSYRISGRERRFRVATWPAAALNLQLTVRQLSGSQMPKLVCLLAVAVVGQCLAPSCIFNVASGPVAGAGLRIILD
jgi:hypothetical protein